MLKCESWNSFRRRGGNKKKKEASSGVKRLHPGLNFRRRGGKCPFIISKKAMRFTLVKVPDTMWRSSEFSDR